jgi:hypothetical protein
VAAAAALLPTAAHASDLTGRAIFSYQDFGTTAGLESDAFRRTYELRLERHVVNPLRLRLTLRADHDDGDSDAGRGRLSRSFRRFQPNAELFYNLDKLDLQGSWYLVRQTAFAEGAGEREQRLDRLAGRASWRPDGLPTLTLLSERRGTFDAAAEVDRTESLLQGSLDYVFRDLTVSASSRRTTLDDGELAFARESLQNQGTLSYDHSFFGGRLTTALNASVLDTRIDERAAEGAISVPTPVTITRAAHARDDTPLDDVDRPPVALPALIDGALDRGAGVFIGPGGDSYQNLSLDLARPSEVDTVRVVVRDRSGLEVPSGGGLAWDAYQSPDGVRWTPLPTGAATAFVTGLSAYEVRFPVTTSRYFKVVNPATSTVDSEVTEVQAFLHAAFGAGETRRTDVRIGNGIASVTAQPTTAVTLSYYGLFNGLRQTSDVRPELTSDTVDQTVSLGFDPHRLLGFIARYQDRRLTQSDGFRQDFLAYTGIVRVGLAGVLDETVEAIRTEEDNGGRASTTDTLSFRTYARPYPSWNVSVDAGLQRQRFAGPGIDIDRRHFNAVSSSQLTRRLKLSLSVTLQNSDYDAGLLPGLVPEGLPVGDDRRWTVELFYRSGPQLAVAARLGHAKAAQVSGTVQNYHLDWYPFPGGAVRLGGSYTQDIDAIGQRQVRRLSLVPSWTLNRRVIVNLNYATVDQEGDAVAGTRSFYTTVTLIL